MVEGVGHPREEVEEAFRHYFMTGPVEEDWIAWSKLFTDDAVYWDHYWGRFTGPAEVQMFLESTMSAAAAAWTIACGSARPISSEARMQSRRAMKIGSAPPSIIRANQ